MGNGPVRFGVLTIATCSFSMVVQRYLILYKYINGDSSMNIVSDIGSTMTTKERLRASSTILPMHQRAEYGKVMTFMSLIKTAQYGSAVDDQPRSLLDGDKRIVSPDGYNLTLSVRNGLPYVHFQMGSTRSCISSVSQ
jgi:hypothetical protein